MSPATYPEYQDSGVTWLGSLPMHWLAVPLWSVASCNDEVLAEATPGDSEINYLEISGVTAGVGITELTGMTFKDAPSRARRKVQQGDVLVSTVRTYLRAIAAVVDPPANLVASTGFAVLRPRQIHPGFLGYAVQGEFFISEVIARSVGVSYPAINASDLVRIVLPLPPLPEQTDIVAFLDRETGKIDTLVEEQKRLIVLLKEKRQAVISHAVTKGLNPDAPMKDTRIEWLGQVPEHWEVKRLKYLGEAIIGLTYSPDDVTDETTGLLVLRSSNVVNDRIVLEDNVFVTASPPSHLLTRLGDVLICSRNGSRALIGKNAVIGPSSVGVTFGAFMTVFRSEYNEFLSWTFKSRLFEAQAGAFMSSTINQLTTSTLNSMEVAVPPADERTEIAAFLKEQTAKLDELQEEALRAISILQERRAALISAAVTGKIDVRGLTETQEAAE